MTIPESKPITLTELSELILFDAKVTIVDTLDDNRFKDYDSIYDVPLKYAFCEVIGIIIDGDRLRLNISDDVRDYI